MTRAEIVAAIDKIRSLAAHGNDEQCHCLEDQLRRAVLEAIATGALVGCTTAQAAALALQTESIAFSRWYA